MSLPSRALIANHALVMVSLMDQDMTTTEYLDELTGNAASLSRQGEPIALRAVVASEHVENVTVTPLTELAVRWLEETVTASDFAESYQEVANAVASLFNVHSVWSIDISFTNEDDFDVTDGIQAAEAYGKALALLSAMDAVTGSPQATLTKLTEYIHYDAESKALTVRDNDLAPLQTLVQSAQAIWASVHPDIALNTAIQLESLTVQGPSGDSIDPSASVLDQLETTLGVNDASADATTAPLTTVQVPGLDLTTEATANPHLWG